MDAKKIISELLMWQLKHNYITKMNMIKMTHHLKKESKTQDKDALDKYAKAKEDEKQEWIEQNKEETK